MANGLSNAAVINWTKSMSLQYAADDILVTTVAPGSIETPRTVRNRQREVDIKGVSLDEQLKARVQDIPLKRLGRPEEVASVVVFLASEPASYVTGTCVTVDGGVTRGI
jgi:3-oxoacyl-[acyl-carrier protein] reductase